MSPSVLPRPHNPSTDLYNHKPSLTATSHHHPTHSHPYHAVEAAISVSPTPSDCSTASSVSCSSPPPSSSSSSSSSSKSSTSSIPTHCTSCGIPLVTRYLTLETILYMCPTPQCLYPFDSPLMPQHIQRIDTSPLSIVSHSAATPKQTTATATFPSTCSPPTFTSTPPTQLVVTSTSAVTSTSTSTAPSCMDQEISAEDLAALADMLDCS